ncbi:aminodeoxychorismate synthase component I [Edaphobacter albus]|uniref:aminodeoxychorismate synthase component I n=1 Tax=Edaphobacter sp. 4G125 TaxID=2763071 RepID=UPI001645B862|nr:aminodeoxychorismate synthase component I [Edaphobacter sp. 4G125]QNI37287.1 aminodeoxychorismate synthase component I [Edaphobacter sp. 4G125]
MSETKRKTSISPQSKRHETIVLSPVPAWTPLPLHLRTLAATSSNAVLLETSRYDEHNRRSYLFLEPVEIVAAHTMDDLPALFDHIESARSNGLHLAGYFHYECGYFFERNHFQQSNMSPGPIAWFGAYSEPIVFDHLDGVFLTTPPSSVDVEPTPASFATYAALSIPQGEYEEKIDRIQRYIASGDTYQVNFTDRVAVYSQHSAAASFAALVAAQPVAYSALIHHDNRHILSLSPELFFRIEGNRIITRPMKGTMPRGLDLAEDEQQVARLQADEKNRSEHVMIVDLLRNDLGRICRSGSVHVEDLFSVERYQTLLQMTSTISGEPRSGLAFYDIFRALFPSGSITGAPKLRTMQIIQELERSPRGVYTGAIGYIAPSGDTTFNVAIRTVVLRDGIANMGVGGGIVADSNPSSEYRECQLKASFLTRQHQKFQLIETMLFDGTTVPYLALHLDRLSASAQYFDYSCDHNAIASRISSFASTLPAARHSIRLLLSSDGEFTLTSSALAPDAPAIAVRISPHRTYSGDVFLRHKTTQRDLYNSELSRARAEGFDEVLFLNERGELTEGAISNLFIRRDCHLLTPPLPSGVLPGILRRHILTTDPTACEQILVLEDLNRADAIYLGNSVRGLRQVTRLETNS